MSQHILKVLCTKWGLGVIYKESWCLKKYEIFKKSAYIIEISFLYLSIQPTFLFVGKPNLKKNIKYVLHLCRYHKGLMLNYKKKRQEVYTHGGQILEPPDRSPPRCQPPPELNQWQFIRQWQWNWVLVKYY